MSNLGTNILEAIQVAWRCLVLHSLRFLAADYHLSYLHHLQLPSLIRKS